MKKILILFILVFCLGCAHVISEETRSQVDKDVSYALIFKDPDALKGYIVIIGGIIIESKNTQEGTYIEVLQKPLDYRGYPKDTDVSYGRFIIIAKNYLDTAIYVRGRQVTVAGEVLGKKMLRLDEIEYPYPLIRSREIHLLDVYSGFPVHFSIGVFGGF